jgi:hypothetical protein
MLEADFFGAFTALYIIIDSLPPDRAGVAARGPRGGMQPLS